MSKTAPAIEARRRSVELKTRSGGGLDVDAAALEAALKRAVRGEVRFDDGARALYSHDSSNYRQIPIGLVVPQDQEDAVRAIEVCHRFGAPITSRGAGTSLAGQTCNVAVILDFSKEVDRLVEINWANRWARVEPGVICDDLRYEAQKKKLTFAADTSTHGWCTIGGMIGNNSCGVHSVMGEFYGVGARTSDNVEELDIVTWDGVRMRVGATSDEEYEKILREGGRKADIYRRLRVLRDKYADLIRERMPEIPRRVSGYNLDDLLPEKGFHVARALVGTEGTCATVLEAKVSLIEHPPARALLVLGYPDVYHAGDHIMEVLEFKPTGLEGVDQVLIDDMKKKGMHTEDISLLPEGGGWLLVEFGGDTDEEAAEKAGEAMRKLRSYRNAPHMKLVKDRGQQEKMWLIRESGLGATARVPGEVDTWEGWEDAAVPPRRLGEYLRDFRKLLQRYDYSCSLYGHFGQGCVHTRIDFGLKTKEGVAHYRSFVEEAAQLVSGYNGSLSGEHGDGQSRGELLERMYGPELVQAFREFKAIWDPDNRMNPHKVIDPYRVDENLKFGPEYDPPQVATHFKFPDDNGSFSYALERCVGVGKCRKTEHGTMCPSYMVTKEEEHSTRGRSRMLFELLQGEAIGKNGWKDEHVKEALDLCLACKACKSECPVNVDMATYKAEFLSHYYKGRVRPRPAYAMGLIYWWARLASGMPRVANFFTQTRPFSVVAKRLAGLAVEREMPPFAESTFREWFQQRPTRNTGKPKVILWPDTFTNYFQPEIAKAGVEVLEAAGFQVELPSRSLCCGRPLYDYGMLPTAIHLLEQVMDTMREQIREGIPVVGLEPSCVATFRDELTGLFPTREEARRLSSSFFTLAEFLEKKADGFQWPQLQRKALVHRHCHHTAIMKFESDEKVLAKLGLDFEVLDSGCCGMAGSFGFEAENYEVSVQCGERELLPRVRKAGSEVMIIADGFSCREQVQQLSRRQPLHLAQVIQIGLRGGEMRVGSGDNGQRRRRKKQAGAAVALLAGAALAGGAWLLWKSRQRTRSERRFW